MNFNKWYKNKFGDIEDDEMINISFKDICGIVDEYESTEKINIDYSLASDRIKELSESLKTILKNNFGIDDIDEYVKNINKKMQDML